MSTLSVIIPAYNEQGTLAAITSRVLALRLVTEVVIVNDCSRDRTAEIADALARQDPRVRVWHQPENRGKTEALKSGISLTTGEVVIVQDADFEYDPAEIPDVVEPILLGKADVVYGSRFLARKAARVAYFRHSLANKTLTLLSNVFTNLNMTDVETCYKAFRGDILRRMKISSSGFGFEIEVTAKVAKLNCCIYEVPIGYQPRTFEEGKKIGLMDGLAALWYIVRYNVFCSLQDSFTEKPQSSTMVPDPETVSRTSVEDSRPTHR